MASDVATDPAVVTLAANAATRIAGQTCGPRRRSAANASPVGGQIGEAFGLIEASISPALANAK